MIDRSREDPAFARLPPIADAGEMRRLRWELRFTRREWREDAIAEAWLAFVANEDAALAVGRLRKREMRNRRRERTNYFEDRFRDS